MNTAEATIASRIARNFPKVESLIDDSLLAGYEVDGFRPAIAICPRSAEEISELIRFAAAEKLAVIPCRARTKLSIGAPPAHYDVALDLSRMNRVLAYEPRDLTLAVEPGVSISELAETLKAENQFVPLDPPFAEAATAGGVIATDSPGPLRQRFGGPRDFVLGMEFVTGYGVQSKSGGRVVKNVTGYDLHKPLIGSLGTLAVITRINFKTFPLPQTQTAFLAAAPDFDVVHALFRAIADSPLEPFALVALSGNAPADVAAGRASASFSDSKKWSVLIVAAGSDAVVARHRREISSFAARIPSAQLVELTTAQQSAAFAQAREFPRIATEFARTSVVFRISALLSTMPNLVQRLTSAAGRAQVRSAFAIHAFGLMYFALLPPEDLPMESLSKIGTEIYTIATEAGAHARIEFAGADLKRRLSVWGPRRDDFELMARVKRTFDPENILSPGRFVEGV